MVQKRLQKLFAKLPIYHTLTVSFCSPCTYGLHSAEVHLRDALPWSAVPAGGEMPVQPGSKRALHLIPPEMAASSHPEHFHCPFVASDEPKHLPNSLPYLPKLGLCSPWLTPPLMPLLWQLCKQSLCFKPILWETGMQEDTGTLSELQKLPTRKTHK